MSVTALDDYRAKLGGSTLPAAAGVDPYRSPIRLALEMRGDVQREASEAMRLGQLLEPVIFAYANERGFPCAHTPGIEVQDEARSWLLGHIDGVGVSHLDGTVIDAKASGRPWDGLPVQYEAQLMTYMHLSGYGSGMILHLSGLTFTVYTVERHERLIDVLLYRGEQFMAYIREGVLPPVTGHPDDRQALALAYPEHVPASVRRETREVRDSRRELAGLLQAEKARHARIEHLRAIVTEHMGEAERLIDSHDNEVATWKASSSRRIDTARLKASLPDVYESYSTESTTRRFLLK